MYEEPREERMSEYDFGYESPDLLAVKRQPAPAS